MCTTIRHDAFGRDSTLRRRVYLEQWQFTAPGCAWCGMLNRTAKGRAYLYEYGAQPDGYGSRAGWGGRLFCSVACMRSHS